MPCDLGSREQAWEEGMTWDDSYKAAKRYLPFSEGARSCAGMSLAKVNLTACLATLLGHFKFRLAEEVSAMRQMQGLRY